MRRVGFVGWRGMVGSVLMDRMKSENDFTGFEPVFFTTSNVGGKGPDVGLETGPLLSAHDVDALAKCDVIVTCQGGDYTTEIHPKLRAAGWKGYFIDAASSLRMKDHAVHHPRPGEPQGDRRGARRRAFATSSAATAP